MKIVSILVIGLNFLLLMINGKDHPSFDNVKATIAIIKGHIEQEEQKGSIVHEDENSSQEGENYSQQQGESQNIAPKAKTNNKRKKLTNDDWGYMKPRVKKTDQLTNNQEFTDI